MTGIEFQNLLRKYQEGCVSDKEKALIEQWLEEFQSDATVENWNEEEIALLKSTVFIDINEDKPKAKISKVLKIAISSVAAACCLLFGLYLYTKYKAEPTIVQAENIYPSEDQATITLENGEVIVIDDSAKNLFSKNGKLLYDDSKEVIDGDNDLAKSQKIIIHTPKGKQMSLVLEDGTKVWLNAQTTFTYPTVFSAVNREVSVQGEAYFEVAHQIMKVTNKRRPFIVNSNGHTIEVLGTKFNVKSYDKDNLAYTTLFSGSVNIKNAAGASRLLKPGQESKLNKVDQSIEVKNVDVEENVSWRNNLFSFQDADLREIMDEIERWYTIKIAINNWPKDRFYGQVKRDEPLSEVIKMIEASSNLRFKIIQVNNERRITLNN